MHADGRRYVAVGCSSASTDVDAEGDAGGDDGVAGLRRRRRRILVFWSVKRSVIEKWGKT